MQKTLEAIKGIARPFPINDFRKIRQIFRRMQSDVSKMIKTEVVTVHMVKTLESDANAHARFYFDPNLPEDTVRMFPDLDKSDVRLIHDVLKTRISGTEKYNKFETRITSSFPELLSGYGVNAPKIVIDQVIRLTRELAIIEYIIKRIKVQLGSRTKRKIHGRKIEIYEGVSWSLRNIYPTMENYRSIYWVVGVDREKILTILSDLSTKLEKAIECKELTDKEIIPFNLGVINLQNNMGNSINFGYRGTILKRIIKKGISIHSGIDQKINMITMKKLIDELSEEYETDISFTTHSDFN